MGFLSLCIHLKGLLLLMVRRLCIMVYVCCEELRRYFNNIIDKSLFFLVIRSLANKMAKSIALWRIKWRSQSLFGEENGEVYRSLAKKWRKMAKSIALWRRNGEENGEVNRSLAKKWRSQSLFGEIIGEVNRSLAK